MPLIYLDTNIYRQLGLKFYENLNFKNLISILDVSGNEFNVLEVVKAELLDFYRNEVFDEIRAEHEKLYKKYLDNPYLPDIPVPETTIPILKAMESVAEKLMENRRLEPMPDIPSQLILDFLLHNKGMGKDETRDFLIFCTLIEVSKTRPKDHIIFITRDKIFTDNSFLKKIIIRENIQNLIVHESIENFLKDFGPKLEFVTAEKILAHIDQSVIKNELIKEQKALPSYISDFYYDLEGKDIPDLDTLVISDMGIENFYIVRDYNTNKLKLIVSLRVKVVAKFHPEENLGALGSYFDTISRMNYSYPEDCFDDENRPIFDHNVLFIFQGTVNEKSETIENLDFIDFFPDHYIMFENRIGKLMHLGILGS